MTRWKLLATLLIVLFVSGAGLGTSPTTLAAADSAPVLICHHADDQREFEIVVDEQAVPAHVLLHGDTIGACDGGGGDPI